MDTSTPHMAFLFKRNPKTPPDLVRALNDLLGKLDLPNDSRKNHDECLRYLKQVKVVLYGDDENDPHPDQISLLSQELYALDCLFHLLSNLHKLDFDLRKDVVLLFLTLLRRKIGNELPTVEYLVYQKPEILVLLMRSPEHPETALVCGQMLRDSAKFEAINRFILYHPLFWNFFKYAQIHIFEIATDVFVTLQQLFSQHKKLVSEFSGKNCEQITTSINHLIRADNYVTKRQSVRLLSELAMQKLNHLFLMYYFDDTTSLKLVMLLLSDKLKNVQMEAFHLFKFFVAKPKKSQKIFDILIKNKENFVQFFNNFDVSGTGTNIVDERDYIMGEIQKLPDIERIH